MTVTAAAFADRWRVDDRHHLCNVLAQQSIKERFISILKRVQKNVAFEIAVFAPIVFVNPRELLIDCRAVIRKQAQQSQPSSLGFRKSAAFVQQRMIQERMTDKAGFRSYISGWLNRKCR